MRRALLAFVLAAAVAAPLVPGGGPASGAEDDRPALVFADVTIVDGLGSAPRQGSVAVSGGRLRTAVPAGARRISVEGAYLAPGFVEPACRTGYAGADAEVTRELTPAVDALDLVDPAHSAFSEGALEGCTTAVVVPGASNLVGGLTQAWHTTSPSGRAVPIEGAPKALAAAMGDAPGNGNFPARGGPTTSIYARRPTTRMGVVWMLRQTFLAAKGIQPAPDGADLTLVREVLDGKRALRLYANAVQDLNAALRFGDEVGCAFVIEAACEGYMVEAELGRRKASVIVGPLPDERTGRGPEGCDSALQNAAILRDAGCRVALTAGEGGPRWYREQGMFAARYGFSREQALAAVTSIPADLCGLSDRGRIEDGAAADVVLWRGHPMLPSSRLLMVVIDGRVVLDRTTED